MMFFEIVLIRIYIRFVDSWSNNVNIFFSLFEFVISYVFFCDISYYNRVVIRDSRSVYVISNGNVKIVV